MADICKLTIDGKTHEMPIITGTEQERGIDISALRSSTECITLDDGYGNTGSCQSKVTFIDGEKGILRYRGYDIEDLAEKSTFAETSYLVIFGELPDEAQLAKWSGLLTQHELLHEAMRHHFEGFPANAHPMAILSAMINATSCFHPDLLVMDMADPSDVSKEKFMDAAARIISKIRTIAAFAYKKSIGQPPVYPKPELEYTANFLHMMFSVPYQEYDLKPEVVDALRLLLILHADHEQNCSTSTVRMVASSGANLFASAAAGVCALWGPLHGGANQEVIEMLTHIHKSGEDLKAIVARAKDKKSGFRLMGFGHRVYKNYDPRARIIKAASDKMLDSMKINDPLLDIARRLEEVALSDSYFIDRKLYPNVDFYSGIILRAIGIPTDMYTVMFAIGRMPGWVAHWKETRENPAWRIYRPRQIYQGHTRRPYVPMDKRS